MGSSAWHCSALPPHPRRFLHCRYLSSACDVFSDYLNRHCHRQSRHLGNLQCLSHCRCRYLRQGSHSHSPILYSSPHCHDQRTVLGLRRLPSPGLCRKSLHLSSHRRSSHMLCCYQTQPHHYLARSSGLDHQQGSPNL